MVPNFLRPQPTADRPQQRTPETEKNSPSATPSRRYGFTSTLSRERNVTARCRPQKGEGEVRPGHLALQEARRHGGVFELRSAKLAGASFDERADRVLEVAMGPERADGVRRELARFRVEVAPAFSRPDARPRFRRICAAAFASAPASSEGSAFCAPSVSSCLRGDLRKAAAADSPRVREA